MSVEKYIFKLSAKFTFCPEEIGLPQGPTRFYQRIINTGTYQVQVAEVVYFLRTLFAVATCSDCLKFALEKPGNERLFFVTEGNTFQITETRLCKVL